MASLSTNDLRHYLTQRIGLSDADGKFNPPTVARNGNGEVRPRFRSAHALLKHVLSLTSGGLPRALLVAGLSPTTDATHAAIDIARALVGHNEVVALVDLAEGASAISGPLGMPRVPGLTDLEVGRVSFSDTIRIDDDTPLQVITAGSPAVRNEGHKVDMFMRVFNTLTEAYGCIVLHADPNAINTLMPALKFELPLMVAVLPKRASAKRYTVNLNTFQALRCPMIVYETRGKPWRLGLFRRGAAIRQAKVDRRRLTGC